MKNVFDKLPVNFRAAVVPLVLFITLIVINMIPAVVLQDYVTYALLVITAIASYTEYRRFIKARDAGVKTPLEEVSDGDGS